MMGIVWTLARVSLLEAIRRKDIYVVLILLGALALWLGSTTLMGVQRGGNYVGDIALLATWVATLMIAIGAANRQLPGEEKRGTIFPLLARPVTRLELILGKWVGTLLACATATTLFYVVSVLALLMAGRQLSPAVLGQTLLLHVCGMAVVAAFTMCLSTRLNADASLVLSILLTLASLLLVPRIPAFLAAGANARSPILEVLYYALPHLELFDMRQRLLFGYAPLPLAAMIQLVGYAGLLCGGFLTVTWLAYRGKVFTRTSVE